MDSFVVPHDLAYEKHWTRAAEIEVAKREENERCAIMDALTVDFKALPDMMLDDAGDFMAQVFSIMADRDHDKEGRINDLVYFYVNRYVNWIKDKSDSYREDDFAKIGVEL